MEKFEVRYTLSSGRSFLKVFKSSSREVANVITTFEETAKEGVTGVMTLPPGLRIKMSDISQIEFRKIKWWR